MDKFAIVIPAYEPDERLISLINDLVQKDMGPIFIVNDGSGDVFDSIFDAIKDKVESSGGVILKHEVNRGKGRALKTAFTVLSRRQTKARHTLYLVRYLMHLRNRKGIIAVSRNVGRYSFAHFQKEGVL